MDSDPWAWLCWRDDVLRHIHREVEHDANRDTTHKAAQSGHTLLQSSTESNPSAKANLPRLWCRTNAGQVLFVYAQGVQAAQKEEDVGMSDRERLARELMGWIRRDVQREWQAWATTDGEWQVDFADWRPDKCDSQAQMVLRKVTTLGKGYTWDIRTWAHSRRGVVHNVDLYQGGMAPSNKVYGTYSDCVTNRNAHIVAAAIVALDAMKPAEPQPHRCKGMDKDALWRLVRGGIKWDFYNYADRCIVKGAVFCHFCGYDLNVPDSRDD